jgi:nucleoid-associated protein YgaU
MEIWLKKSEADKIRLPVLPDSFEVTDAMNNVSVTLHALGEVSLKGTRGLLALPLASFFPAQEYAFLNYTDGLLTPYEYVDKIRSWLDKVIQVIITDTNINFKAKIERFAYGEDDSTGDVAYSLDLKEHREISFGKKRTAKDAAGSYKVKKGDTLKGVAKKTTGSASNSGAIYKANKAVIEKAAKKHKRKSSKKGKYLYAGTKLVIPAKLKK